MQLLVSVRDAEDARAALEGGADIVDAKDPAAGALGAVSPADMRGIVAAVGALRPVSAALGEAREPDEIEGLARAFASTGPAFVKVGFAGITTRARAADLVQAAVRGAASAGRGCGVVVVSYADAPAPSLSPIDLLEIAARTSAAGVLLDTADKSGPGLLRLVTPSWLAQWVARALEARLFSALAGKLTGDDLAVIQATGADIAGVRGAACVDGRHGRVSAARVRELRAARGATPRPSHLTVSIQSPV